MKMELNNFTDLEKISPLTSRTHGVISERKVQAVGRAGQAVNMAVERFITIGELIADDNPEIKSDMYSFCRDARDAGKSIEHLCEISSIEDMDYLDLAKRSYAHTDIVIASRSLLSSITRVLLLVDIVVVKQLLTAKRKITKSLEKLESIMNFAEFVRAFSVFGLEMIELAYLTGNQQNRLKEERHRAQMFSARQMLEHSITILITSSRNSLVHGDCLIAKENRDTVFCQIRRAMDLIHFVIKDSIFDGAWFAGNSTSSHHHHHHHHQPTLGFKNGEHGTIFTTLKHLNYLMETLRQEYKISEKSICMANNNCNKLKSYNDKSWYNDCLHQRIPYQNRWDCGSRWLDAETLPFYSSELKEQLLLTFEKLLEKTHDFTDSAYTSHMHRENILLHCDRCKLEFNKYYNKTLKNHQYGLEHIDTDIDCVLNAVKSLSKQLVMAVTNQANELLFSLNMSINILDDFRAAAMQQDLKRLEEQSNRFHDYSDHIIDVCKLMQHIAFTETLQVQAKCLAMNLRIYGPQILTAVKILFKYPDSDSALENFDAFAKMWKWLTTEMNSLAKQVIRTTNLGADGRPDAYNTSENFDVAPYTGKNSVANPTSTTVPVATAAGGNATTVAAAADGTQPPNELSKFDELNPNDNNDILKRAKNMSAMAFSMYQFTKGSGTLKTTQDLFTQAEYFAEEANRLYKVLRQFSYQVPASPNKKDLLNILDTVPTFVQTLQFTVKDHTVGKAATFVKVDHVIKETKELMSVINKVVEKCFECANKFKLDFTGITGDIAACSSRGDDCNASGMGDSKGTTNSSEGSM